MADKHLFEYAVIRIVPQVERGEFINAGVVLYCRDERYLDAMTCLDEARLRALSARIDVGEIGAALRAFHQICIGGTDAGTIGQLPVAERFRWLTASRSTIVQCSPVHSGLCDDAQTALLSLFERLVLC